MNYTVAQHIFANHLLQKQNLVPVLKLSNEQTWPSFYLFFCLILLVLIKVNALPRVIRIIQSTFSSQTLQQLEREENNPFKFYSLALNLLFILNLSFLVYKINSVYKFVLVETSLLTQFSFFFFIILISFSFKVIVNRLLSFFTDKTKVIAEYSISSTLINQSFGLFLFPLIILMEFSPLDPLIFIAGALIVFATSVIIKWYRGVIMGLVEERIGILQIFSYFCGLEILPVFVLVKYIVETF